MEEDDFYAGGAGDDNGEVVFDDGAHHGHGEAVGEVWVVGLLANEIDAGATCGEDKAAKGKEEVHGDSLWARDVKFPGEDHGHGVEHHVVAEHEDAVEVVEVGHVDAA